MKLSIHGGGPVRKDKIHSGREENRVHLHTVVPLKAPFTVGVSPCELCNFRCIYCQWGTPVGIPGATIMPWDDFVNISGQIGELYDIAGVKCKNFRFNGNGEPLLNPKMPDMVEHIRESGFAERIEITTNASLLTNEFSDKVIEAGLTRLIVSLQGINAKRYHEVCGKKIDFTEFLDGIDYFYNAAVKKGGNCKVHIKILEVALKPEEHSSFYDLFQNKCDTLGVENIAHVCQDVKYEEIFPQYERERTRYDKPFEERRCCDTLFYLANILPNGDVNACGCKWPPHVIGNLFEKSLKEIWNCGQHKEEMIIHLRGQREAIPDCKACLAMAQYTMPEDNLDEHMEEILERIMWGGGVE